MWVALVTNHMDNGVPELRRDLEFFPVQQGSKQLVLIRDHLGLVQEGRAFELPFYRFMTLLDGAKTIKDIQRELTLLQRGVLVGEAEVGGLLNHLDEAFMLDSENFRRAEKKIVDTFASEKTRASTHSGTAYPADPDLLTARLDEILANREPVSAQEGKVTALVAPHIDLSVGEEVYSSAYQVLKDTSPSRVILLGVGHRMGGDLFCLTEKRFETPFGVVESDKLLVRELKAAGEDSVADNDFVHRSEHSIEFQIIFLQHILKKIPFTVVPILCGSIRASLPEYSRDAYLQKAGPFLGELKRILADSDGETIIVAGVDFSHIGPKFSHEMPARHIEAQSENHDRNLLKHLSVMDTPHFWEESIKVNDQYNVCGFSALACLLEMMPPSSGRLLEYRTWHEEATRSAVSFAAMDFIAHKARSEPRESLLGE